MTDRHSAYIVVLEKDTRDDDAEDTITALRQIKGVISVEPVVADHMTAIAYARAKQVLSEQLWDALKTKDS